MFAKEESYSLENSPKENFSSTEDSKKLRDKNIFILKNSNQKLPVFNFKIFLGLFYLFLHCIFLQGIYVIIKSVSYISVSQLSLIRYAGIFVFILPVAIYCNNQIIGEKKNWFLLVVRAVLAATGLYLQIVASRYLQLAEVSIVIATYPFMTAVIARIFLKEELGLIQTSTLVITICGLLLSLRLPEVLKENKDRNFDGSFILGLISAIISVPLIAFSIVVLRQLKKVHFTINMLYMSIFGMIENAILNGIFFPFVPVTCGWDQLLCLIVGVFGAATNCFFTLALQVEHAGVATIEKCSIDILLGIVFQILFFSVYPDMYVISGGGLVLISLTVIGIKNWVLTLPEESNKRQRLKWILL